MTTNELKKGAEVFLASGMRARLEDNKKGNTRMATVYGAEVGLFTEMGSVYAHDIIAYTSPDGQRLPIEHTKEQRKVKDLNKTLFGE